MKLSEFDYILPPDLIAQSPAERRDSSRLMVLHRQDGCVEHRCFTDITGYLRPSDIMVVNTTKVIPARLIGRKHRTGGMVELLLLRQESERCWICLSRPGRRLLPGARVVFDGGEMEAEVVECQTGGQRLVRFSHQGEFYQALEKVGRMPLPPYIDRKPEETDRRRYQTVYARQAGAVAAPTAGLHFTEQLLNEIKSRGVEVLEILLHVGWGTFKKVEKEDIRQHRMEAEYYQIASSVADTLSRARKDHRRIFAVGTTTSRALESFGLTGQLYGWTEIFIYPPYSFRMVDALVTNFHLPKSTLLMLVSALVGREHLMRAYQEAIRERYRFYSYGDAMLVV